MDAGQELDEVRVYRASRPSPARRLIITDGHSGSAAFWRSYDVVFPALEHVCSGVSGPSARTVQYLQEGGQSASIMRAIRRRPLLSHPQRWVQRSLQLLSWRMCSRQASVACVVLSSGRCRCGVGRRSSVGPERGGPTYGRARVTNSVLRTF